MTVESDTPTFADRMRERAGTGDPARLPHAHSCGARWSGSETSHCGNCCVTFSGVSTFDRHRKGGACASPQTIGMALIPGRAYEVWGYPADTRED